MNPINERVHKNIASVLEQHGLTMKEWNWSSPGTAHVTVNESGAEFLIGSIEGEFSVLHPQGGWMIGHSFTTKELLDL